MALLKNTAIDWLHIPLNFSLDTLLVKYYGPNCTVLVQGLVLHAMCHTAIQLQCVVCTTVAPAHRGCFRVLFTVVCATVV